MADDVDRKQRHATKRRRPRRGWKLFIRAVMGGLAILMRLRQLWNWFSSDE